MQEILPQLLQQLLRHIRTHLLHRQKHLWQASLLLQPLEEVLSLVPTG